MNLINNIKQYGLKYIYSLKYPVYWCIAPSGKTKIYILRTIDYYFYGTFKQMKGFIENVKNI